MALAQAKIDLAKETDVIKRAGLENKAKRLQKKVDTGN
jgi:hypothetical protein